MKQRDDMLNSLKVLLEIKGKKAAAGGETGSASNVPKPQNVVQNEPNSMMSGLIKLNPMPPAAEQ